VLTTVRLIEGPIGDVYRDLPIIEVEVEDHLMGLGGWVVTTPNREWIAEAWNDRPASGLWMRIIDEDQPDVMHGGWVDEYEEDEETITFSGLNANGWIAGLLSVPEPSTFEHPFPPRTDYAFTRPNTQTASESIYDLVNLNLGDGDLLDPRYLPISTSTAALQTIGQSVDLESIPFERIMETIYRWGLEGGLVVDFGYDNGGVSLDMRTPTLVGFRLAEQDGVLRGWKWRETGPTATHVLAAGDGEDINRRVQDVAPYGPGFNYDGWGNVRKEAFVDSNTAEANAALLEGYTVLREGQPKRGVESRAIASRLGVRYKVNYQLGDIVGVVFRGVEYYQLITTVTLKWNRRGLTEQIGTGQPDMAGVNLGRQPAYTILSPTGIAVGNVRPRSLYDETLGATAPLEFEVVFSQAVSDPADEAEWRIEQRVDGGSWTQVTASVGIGLDEVRNEWISFDYTLPAYTQSVEVKAVLISIPYGTKETPSFLVAGQRDQLALSVPAGPYDQGAQKTFSFEVPYDLGDGASLRVERAPATQNLWEYEPGFTEQVFPTGRTAGPFTAPVLPSAGVWRWRVVTVDGYQVVASVPAGPVTVNATDAPVFTESPTFTGGSPPTEGLPVEITSSGATGDPTPVVTYEWRLDGVPIGGATAAVYTPVSGDVGGVLSVVLTATNVAGTAQTTVVFGAVAAAPSGGSFVLINDAGDYLLINDAGDRLLWED